MKNPQIIYSSAFPADPPKRDESAYSASPESPKRMFLFLDYQPVGWIDMTLEPALLNAVVLFQKDASRNIDAWHTFTALDWSRGLAFSQEYARHADSRVSYGPMGKHERGVGNPGDTPSFGDLIDRMLVAGGHKTADAVAASAAQSLRDVFMEGAFRLRALNPAMHHVTNLQLAKAVDGALADIASFAPAFGAPTATITTPEGASVTVPASKAKATLDAIDSGDVWTASESNPVTVYYCKAGVKTGETVRVLQGTSVWTGRGVRFSGVTGEMIHNNAKGKPKASGARCVFRATAGMVVKVEGGAL